MSNRFDYKSKSLIGEVKYGLRAVPIIRSSIIRLADALSKDPDQQGFLLLIDSYVSKKRINEEWSLIQRIMDPAITKRLKIFLKHGKSIDGWPEEPDEEMSAHLTRAVKDESSETGIILPKAGYFSVIFKILLLDWLGHSSQKSEVMTMKRLGELAGCSYPTVALATDRLKAYLQYSRSKGIQLRRFPNEEWHSMILGANKIRATQRLVDRSGQSRRPKFLLERLAKMQLDHVSVGGVPGALAVYPDLNITGNPRLDLCIHAPGKTANMEFVKKLDPALEPANDQLEPAQVVLHFVRSKHSFFEQGLRGIQRASWVECMLDLHEMRLGAQADEWLFQWIREKENSNG